MPLISGRPIGQVSLSTASEFTPASLRRLLNRAALVSDPIRAHLAKLSQPKTAETISKIRVSKEAQEGLEAFLEKRKPKWKNNAS